MEEETKIQEETPVKPTGKEKTVVLQVAIGILLVVIAVLLYLLLQPKNSKTQEESRSKEGVEVIEEKKEEEKEVAPIKEDTATPPESTKSNLPNKNESENIKAVLDTNNTQPMGFYMAPKVEIYYNSSTPSTSLDPDGATGSLSYLEDAKTPWKFPLSESEKAPYANKAGFEKLFSSNCLVGKSANSGHLVSFCYNEDSKIDSIFLSRDLSIFK